MYISERPGVALWWSVLVVLYNDIIHERIPLFCRRRRCLSRGKEARGNTRRDGRYSNCCDDVAKRLHRLSKVSFRLKGMTDMKITPNGIHNFAT